jgi:hypothetical protein
MESYLSQSGHYLKTARKDKNMKNLLRYSLLALAITFSASTTAHAQVISGGLGSVLGDLLGDLLNLLPPPPSPPKNPPSTHTGPEVDPGMAIAGFTLLAGTLTVMRARRARE